MQEKSDRHGFVPDWSMPSSTGDLLEDIIATRRRPELIEHPLGGGVLTGGCATG